MSDDLEEGAFPASEETPGQAESRSAYQRFQEMGRKIKWIEEWRMLRMQGWDWRKAAFIAWSVVPADRRWPETLEGLAREVLGLRSDRTIRKWRYKNPGIDQAIEALRVDLLQQYVPDVLSAWVKVASDPDPSAHRDRITFLTAMKVYNPRLALTGDNGGPIRHRDESDFSDLDDAELQQVIRNLQSAAGNAG